MTKVTGIYEQLTIDGTTDYVVHYDDGSVWMLKDYPTDDDLRNPAKVGGWKAN